MAKVRKFNGGGMKSNWERSQQVSPGHPSQSYSPTKNPATQSHWSGNGGTSTRGNGKKKTVTADGKGIKTAATVYSAIKHPVLTAAKWVGKNIFQPKTAEQKRASYTKKGLDITNPAEMHRATTRTPVDTSGGGDGIAALKTTVINTSLASTPTADVNTRHQWGFQAYPGTPGTTYDPKTYAKQGKMIGKYGTGQEIKNFSKGKRFGPPPLKGPDPQGLQTVLESSDYFKKLIG